MKPVWEFLDSFTSLIDGNLLELTQISKRITGMAGDEMNNM